MNISIRACDNKVRITFHGVKAGLDRYDIDVDQVCHSELEASFLADALLSQLTERANSIREKAYNAGWHDKASKKRPKRKFFSFSFNHDGV